MLQLDSKGAEVRELQALLNKVGYRDDEGHMLAEDGDFGAKTDRAVEWFQAAHALEVDGAAGPITMAHLEALAAGPPAEQPPAGTVSVSLALLALSRARAYHAAGVRESPWGSNRGGPAPGAPAWASVTAIQRPWFSKAGQHWCAMTVAQCYRYAGLADEPGWPPLVSSWTTWAEHPSRRLFRPANGAYVPQPGDLFCCGTTHIGMVEHYDPKTGRITSIEGNSGNRVASLSRPKSGAITHFIAMSAL